MYTKRLKSPENEEKTLYLSASSSMSLLDPRMMIETVLPGLAIPVIFVHLLAPV
jgi:hypothetical protein